MVRAISFATAAATTFAVLIGLPVSANAATQKVTLRAPSSAIEGERFAVTARISSPKQAKRVEFQRFSKDIWGTGRWTRIRSFAVRRHASRSITVVADDQVSARVRAVVTYSGTKKKGVSKPVTVNYWHWTPLSRFTHYASSGYVIDSDYISFDMNGRSWKGWYSGAGGESRYTLGRNCSRFRGYAGLSDRSADGARGAVTLAVITPENTVQPVWQSPTLAAGAVVPVDISLASPYRFAIAGQNTSAAIDNKGTLPAAYPAIGDAQFLCHFPE